MHPLAEWTRVFVTAHEDTARRSTFSMENAANLDVIPPAAVGAAAGAAGGLVGQLIGQMKGDAGDGKIHRELF